VGLALGGYFEGHGACSHPRPFSAAEERNIVARCHACWGMGFRWLPYHGSQPASRLSLDGPFRRARRPPARRLRGL